MLKDRGFKKIGILGLAYVGDLQVPTLSPTIGMAKELKKLGISVKVQDPLFSAERIKDISGADSFEFPEGLEQFDAVLIVSNHSRYKYTNHNTIRKHLTNCKLVLDNMGCWKSVDFPSSIEYHEAGDANWLQWKELAKE